MDNTAMSSYNACNYVFFIAQCFALLTCAKKEIKTLHFYYNIFLVLVIGILLVFQLIFCISYEINRDILDSISIKVYSILILLLHIKLGLKWPKLKRHWARIDFIMDKHYGRLKKFNLRVFVILGLYLVINIGAFLQILANQNTTNILKFKLYSFVFDYVPPNYLMAITFLIVYFIYFSLSNFNDVFLTVISMKLALRFKQIRVKLELSERNQFNLATVDFWSQIRRDYDRLSHLCKEIDDGISGLILISFAYNLFSVISYLFHQLTLKNVDEEQSIAFYIFFSYLILRLLTVCLYISWINDESLAPVNILNSVSSRNYNSEIGRWLVQMSFDNVALTGWKMFKITRSVFLSVASIIVTYELVIVQFYGFSAKI